MKKTVNAWPLILVAVLISGFLAWTVYGQKATAPARTVWEYRLVGNISQQTLDEYGAAGWELVGYTYGSEIGERVILKRAK